jgi:hypothetical protein
MVCVHVMFLVLSSLVFVGPALQSWDLVLRIIIEYNRSFKGFYPLETRSDDSS